MFQLDPNNFPQNTFLGRLIRVPLALIPRNTVIPILQGSAKGIRWIAGSGLHSMWMGLFEIDKQRILQNLPLSGTTVIDIGANVGFFTVLLSRLVGEAGSVIAVEPLPINLDFINRHINLNKMENITVLPVALSDKKGVMKFASSAHNSSAHLSEDGDLEVPVVTLDSLDDFTSPVSLVKIDVEGAEGDLLRGGEIFFKSHRPTILLATHGEVQVKDCRDILTRYGYSMVCVSTDPYGSGCDEWLVKPNEK